jgi:exosortase D (VPLPA-CTERM-specific)
MSAEAINPPWKFRPTAWLALLAVMTLVVFIYYPALIRMYRTWTEQEEYSHGLIIPFISLFLIWQKSDLLRRMPLQGSAVGLAITLAGLGIYALGELSAITGIVQVSFVITLAGVAFTVVGMRGMREIWAAFVFLLFMIPLPAVIFNELSAHLQLISSQLGVAFIRMFGISVYLAGNVIDLGSMKLQVVEACSGLRYLFPLMSLAFICTYFYKEKFWKRAVVFLSSIPVTILLNSFRIGVIGVLVEYWGVSQAEGFMHDFEGWIVFMGAFAVLFVEMWALSRIGTRGRSFREVFGIEMPASTGNGPKESHSLPAMFFAAAAAIAVAAVLSTYLNARAEAFQPRREFADFPATIGAMHGTSERLESIYLDILRLDDYLMADYREANGTPVNFYVAFYNSQRKGHSVHSPRACLPGGGWKIEDSRVITLAGVQAQDLPLKVNRYVISLGESRQLVYYWFKQRDRILANEYLTKWYVFWDAITRNRTDGALVRLVTPITLTEDIDQADRRLAKFAGAVVPLLPDYVPD